MSKMDVSSLHMSKMDVSSRAANGDVSINKDRDPKIEDPDPGEAISTQARGPQPLHTPLHRACITRRLLQPLSKVGCKAL